MGEQTYQKHGGLAVLLLVVGASFWHVSGQSFMPDYYTYTVWIEDWYETGYNPRPHFLYPMWVTVLDLIATNVHIDTISRLVTTVASVLYAYVLYQLVWRVIRPEMGNIRLGAILTPIIAMCLFVAMPVVIITMRNNNWALGYMSVTYNSPTMILVKPLILPSFFLLLQALDPHRKVLGRTSLLALAIFSVVAVVSKPNYSVGMLPSAAIAGAFVLVVFHRLKYRDLFWGFFFPTVVIIVMQYAALFLVETDAAGAGESGEIVISPFGVFDHHAAITNPYANRLLLLKFVMSCLFPLVVYFSYFDRARRDFAFNFAWLVFFVNAFFNYMVIETGPRLPQWNFQWNGTVGFMILFAVATFFFIRENIVGFRYRLRALRNLRAELALFVFGLHVISGVAWYLAHFSERYRYWY